MCHFRGVEAGRVRPNKNPVVVGQWRCATETFNYLPLSISPSSSSSYRNCFLRVCRSGRRTSSIFALFSLLSIHDVLRPWILFVVPVVVIQQANLAAQTLTSHWIPTEVTGLYSFGKKGHIIYFMQRKQR